MTLTEPMKAADLSKLTKGYENKWVAFSRDYSRVVASAETLGALQQQVGARDVVVMKVLPSNAAYVPAICA